MPKADNDVAVLCLHALVHRPGVRDIFAIDEGSCGKRKPVAHRLLPFRVDVPFLARIDRYLPMEVDTRRAEVVLRFSNGDPALVAAGHERGSILLFTTTANMDWTNLPAKGDYVSLVFNAMAFLSRRHGGHRNIEVGERINEPLTPAQSSWPLRVTTSEGEVVEGRVAPEGDALRLVYGPVERAGVLTAAIGPEVRSYAANVAPEGGDVVSLDANALIALLDRPVSVTDGAQAQAGPAPAPRASELASVGLYAVLVLLVGEMCLGMWFGADRTTAKRRD